jgi:hypothetical protein
VPNISVLKTSRFLKKEDCQPPVLFTIKSVGEENVAKEGAPEEQRWCVHFVETEKPMVLNATNGQIIAAFTGKENMDDWPGTKVVLYHDPTVSFGGKLIGGIRVRAPKKVAAQPKPAPAPAPVEDEVPF